MPLSERGPHERGPLCTTAEQRTDGRSQTQTRCSTIRLASQQRVRLTEREAAAVL